MADLNQDQKELFNRLYQECGLKEWDIFSHHHFKIITRSGIEKIQAKKNIRAHYKAEHLERDVAVIHGFFSMGEQKVETFASANAKTTQTGYFVEVAEKRCLSRGVLKLVGLYAEGYKGEDEVNEQETIEPFGSTANYIRTLINGSTWDDEKKAETERQIDNGLPVISVEKLINKLQRDQQTPGYDYVPTDQKGIKNLTKPR